MIYIVANWKLNGNIDFSKNYGKKLDQFLSKQSIKDTVKVIVCPPFPFLQPLFLESKEKDFFVGSQDCSAFESGAHTGDVSAEMVRESGAKYSLVGHSECRDKVGMKDKEIRDKIICAWKASIVPILCVGESLKERRLGIEKDFVREQVEKALKSSDNLDKLLIAYEPIWAIGTGKTATIEDIESMHQFIKDIPVLKEKKVPVLYGGSVKPDNAKQILSLPSVHGVLVGGASLDLLAFQRIIEAAL